MRVTHVVELHILSSLTPPGIRRVAGANQEKSRLTYDDKHVYGSIWSEPRTIKLKI